MNTFDKLRSLGFVAEHSSPGTSELALHIGNVTIFASDGDGDGSDQAINAADSILLGLCSFTKEKGDDFHGGCELDPNSLTDS